VRIPEGSVIGYDLEEDREKGHHVTDSGIVIIEGKRTPVELTKITL
jgi:glucose-1-phosphate adenylyltransferase